MHNFATQLNKNTSIQMAKNKTERLLAVRRLVTDNIIASQESLLNKLSQEGFSATQATLSRDIKELKIAKIPYADLGYRYVIPDSFDNSNFKEFETQSLNNAGIKSLDFSGPIAVIKTQPGYASVAASLIDSRHFTNIIGTIAGDDTVILVIRENEIRENIINNLSTIFPDLKSKTIK